MNELLLHCTSKPLKTQFCPYSNKCLIRQTITSYCSTETPTISSPCSPFADRLPPVPGSCSLEFSRQPSCFSDMRPVEPLCNTFVTPTDSVLAREFHCASQPPGLGRCIVLPHLDYFKESTHLCTSFS
ncbi:hypothetical protein TRVL_07142 [Trypanosoma vivax]|nr:hypothetical protein TRVL_07142 [Trypanosoma vivax]